MTCPVCGATLPADAIFCGVCGSAVGTREEREAERSSGSASTTVGPPLEPEPAAPSALPAAPEEPQEPQDGEDPDAQSSVVTAAPEEFTRLPAAVRRPAASRFVLVFSTGEHVVVDGTGLIGRRPQAQPGESFDTLVIIDDPGRSVSKTHLEFGQDGGSFWVSDRYSANGTVVREPDKPARLSAPGMRSRVSRGSKVEIGEQFFVVS